MPGWPFRNVGRLLALLLAEGLVLGVAGLFGTQGWVGLILVPLIWVFYGAIYSLPFAVLSMLIIATVARLRVQHLRRAALGVCFLVGVAGWKVVVDGVGAEGRDLVTMFVFVELVAVGFGLVMALPRTRPRHGPAGADTSSVDQHAAA